MDNCYAALRVAVCTALLCCRTTQPARAEHAALLTPTGSNSVGRTFFYWTDPNRTDPVAVRRATQREFMVIAWYPAEANTSDVHALWIPESWALSEAKLLYAVRSNSPNPLTMTEALRAVHESVSSSRYYNSMRTYDMRIYVSRGNVFAWLRIRPIAANSLDCPSQAEGPPRPAPGNGSTRDSICQAGDASASLRRRTIITRGTLRQQ